MMIFVKSFKGYEDQPGVVDDRLNAWVTENDVDVVDIKTSLGHEPGAKYGTGSLVYTVVYRADAPIEE